MGPVRSPTTVLRGGRGPTGLSLCPRRRRRAETMKARRLLFGAAVLLLLFVRTEEAPAQYGGATVQITANVSSHRPDGRTWDPNGGMPDVAICINSAFGQDCNQWRFCPDTLSCVTTRHVPAQGPFSITIFDVDPTSSHDRIGSCQCTADPSGCGGQCGSAFVQVNRIR